jgi:ureidoglycolate lyase
MVLSPEAMGQIMDKRHLTIAALTSTAFAPFGDVIETEGHEHYSINAGTAQRYSDLAKVDVGAVGGRPLISICRAQPIALPFRLRLMERHPLSSQAFIPLSSAPFLIVVAPLGDTVPSDAIRAFRSNGAQGINYRAGTWHHPLLALDRVADFLIVDRGGGGLNCDEIPIDDRGIVIDS